MSLLPELGRLGDGFCYRHVAPNGAPALQHRLFNKTNPCKDDDAIGSCRIKHRLRGHNCDQWTWTRYGLEDQTLVLHFMLAEVYHHPDFNTASFQFIEQLASLRLSYCGAILISTSTASLTRTSGVVFANDRLLVANDEFVRIVCRLWRPSPRWIKVKKP